MRVSVNHAEILGISRLWIVGISRSRAEMYPPLRTHKGLLPIEFGRILREHVSVQTKSRR